MPRIGFWIALDNPDISRAETETLLKSYRINYRIVGRIGRLLILDIERKAVPKVKEIVYRSANIKMASLITSSYESLDIDSIAQSVRNIVNNYIDIKKETIAISVIPYMSNLLISDLPTITKKISYKALKDLEVKIDLKHPMKRIVILLPYNKVYVGLELVGKHKKGFSNRLPSKRPAQSPHSLHPKLARSMVNLSGAIGRDIILDPFCGVGSILMEASLLGIPCIGIDIMYKWVSGASLNLTWLEDQYSDLICGDSLNGFIRDIKYVVTDPPYGRTTTLAGYQESKIVINRFIELASCMDSIRKIVFMAPKEIYPDIEKHGFIEVYKFEIPVHKNLIRILRVIEYHG